jgi:MFS family permease
MNKRMLGISLVDGVKRRNLLCYLFVALLSSGYAGAMAILQPGLLQVMGIPLEQQGKLTGLLGAIQETVFILLLAVFGALADKFGRRIIYAAGLLVCALGFVLYGTASSVTELVLYRVIVAIGSAAMLGMMVTVIADYTENSTRGKANGLQGFVATLGAFIPPVLASFPRLFVDGGLSETQAQQATFALTGALGVVAAILAWCGLSPLVGKVHQQTKTSVGQMLRQGGAAVKDPAIALSYGAAFISRGDLAVTGAFLGLWLVQHGTAHSGMTPSQAMQSLAVPAVLSVVSGAMIGSLLMGFIIDKVSRVRAVTIASGLAALVYCSMFLVTDPTAGWVFLLLFAMGIAEISAFVASQALVGERAPAASRGAVIGFFGVAGAVGILVGTAGGGYLFSVVGPATPFVVFGALNAVVFVWSWWVRTGTASLKKQSAASAAKGVVS